MSRLLARTPVLKFFQDLIGSPILTSAWSQVYVGMPAPVSAMVIFNGSGSVIKMSIGTVGNENASEVAYYITPGNNEILVPAEFKRGSPLSLRAVDVSAITGSLVINFFG